jgi:cyanosortase A-associated protein
MRLRQLMLGCAGLASIVLLGAVALAPVWQSAPTDFQFPEPPVLVGWQLTDSRIGTREVPRTPRAEAVARYDYRDERRLLIEIEVRRFKEATGDVAGYARARLDVTPGVERGERAGLGDYVLFEHEQKLWLSACIDTQGMVTATPAQFDHNRRLKDRTVVRLAAWMAGRAPLEDRRAAWVLIAAPLAAGEREALLGKLEGVLSELALWCRDPCGVGILDVSRKRRKAATGPGRLR